MSLRAFHYLNPHAAFSRAVVFAKEHGLPATELQLAVFDGQSLTASGQRGFDVRVRVAFGVMIRVPTRHQTFERTQNIARHVGIESFLNRNTSRRMRRVNQTQAAFDAALRDEILDLRRDVHHLVGLSCRKTKRVHRETF